MAKQIRMHAIRVVSTAAAAAIAPTASMPMVEWSDGGPSLAPWNGKRCSAVTS